MHWTEINLSKEDFTKYINRASKIGGRGGYGNDRMLELFYVRAALICKKKKISGKYGLTE